MNILNLSQSYFHEKQILVIKNTYSQESDQGRSGGGGERGQEKQLVNFSHGYFHEKQILGIKNAYSQESGQGRSRGWGREGGQEKQLLTFSQ